MDVLENARHFLGAVFKEFLHFIPDEVVQNLAKKVDGKIGNAIRALGDSRFNGNIVSGIKHAMHDPQRFRLMKKAFVDFEQLTGVKMGRSVSKSLIWTPRKCSYCCTRSGKILF